MELNNKGFAITGILYTIFVLFLMILLSVLSGLNIKRKLLEKNMENIKETLEETCENTSVELDEFIPKYQGKYVIQVNGDESVNYVTYLSVGQKLNINNGIIEDISGNGVVFLNVSPTDVVSAQIVTICTNDVIE